MSRVKRLIRESQRRRVFRVAAVYAVVAFVIWQAAEIAVPGLNLPGWVLTLVILLTLLGFPIALILAWALELTPEGIRVTPSAEPPKADADAAIDEARTGAPAAEPVPVRGPTDDRPCVVVLPFANLSGDPENEFFSDGVTEDIMARLAGIRSLRVISRTTAMRYKSSDLSVPQIAGELGAQAVVEGTVRRSAERVRVTAQLIAAERDEHLWAETYDRVLEDVFAVQSDVAENIARALRAELTPGERERLHRKPTENMEAYDLCLKGMRLGESMDTEALMESERYFRGAIALDPGYARAHVGLAWAPGLTGILGNVAPAELCPKMKAAAQEAIKLDPGLGEAHTALALVAVWQDWDWAKAERELEMALKLNPDDSWAFGYWGWTSLLMERFGEAETLLNEAVRLDPRSPLKNVWLAQLHTYTGAPEQGVLIMDRVLRSDPQVFVCRHQRGICHLTAGNLGKAASDFDEAIASSGRVILPVALRGVVHAFSGETERARLILDELRSRATTEYVDPYYLFTLRLSLDGFDAAFPYLEQMLEVRSFLVGFLRIVPRYRELRADPRFLNALRTVWPDDF